MNTQKVFKRYEMKYLVSDMQRAELTALMSEHMHTDEFGRSTISNIYYDTASRQLIRSSMEKPVYKEKLRLRSYGVATDDGKAYIELKKKFKGVVYKRRVELSYAEAVSYLAGGVCTQSGQIMNELDYFLLHYPDIRPSMAIFYDRVAFYGNSDHELRITFDDRILWRDTQLDLRVPASGNPLLESGQSIMEIKTAEAMPLWLSEKLNELGLFKTSFSKYGSGYAQWFAGKSAENERSNFCA